ncbi:hypothetical protein ACFQ7B_32660 [Streptomyces erythrochromogenes]|uniref:hypothetical protein n=1 Tax=Streptomyces erythrochromogenes TaxID=285574 RepID=UPI00367D9B1E
MNKATARMPPREVDRAAGEALEQVHRVQGLALDAAQHDWGALTAEIDHREWLRIAEHVRSTGLAAYGPRTDPNAVEDPPRTRFGDGGRSDGGYGRGP